MGADNPPPQRHRRSWLDAFLDWIEGLPLPTWLVHVLIIGVLALAGVWFDTVRPAPVPTSSALGTVITGVFLSAYHFTRIRTQGAAEKMRTLLRPDAEGADDLARRLAEAPPRLALASLVALAVYVGAVLVQGGEYDAFRMGELPLAGQLVAWAGWTVGETVGLVFVVVSVRRIRIMSRIQDEMIRVSLFGQQALHSFSTVTIATGVSVLFMVLYVPLVSGTGFESPVYFWSAVLGAVFAIAIAVLPLQQAHKSLVGERYRLLQDVGARMEGVLTGLRSAVDAHDSAAIDANQKALGALLAERDLVTRAPTWPWAPGTLRTLATTVLMPVALLIGGRLFDAWLRR